MQLKTKIIELPTFEQLTPDEQAQVIQNYYDINVDYDWWNLDEDFDNIAKILGIDDFEMMFSGFHSQGDGACFTGNYSYAKNMVKNMKEYAPLDKELNRIAQGLFEIQAKNFFLVTAKITHNFRYYHSNSCDFDVYKQVNSRCYGSENEVDNETYEAVKELLRDFMEWIYKNLNNQYDYLTSEDAIKKTLILNEYTFNRETLKIDN